MHFHEREFYVFYFSDMRRVICIFYNMKLFSSRTQKLYTPMRANYISYILTRCAKDILQVYSQYARRRWFVESFRKLIFRADLKLQSYKVYTCGLRVSFISYEIFFFFLIVRLDFYICMEESRICCNESVLSFLFYMFIEWFYFFFCTCGYYKIFPWIFFIFPMFLIVNLSSFFFSNIRLSVYRFFWRCLSDRSYVMNFHNLKGMIYLIAGFSYYHVKYTRSLPSAICIFTTTNNHIITIN